MATTSNSYTGNNSTVDFAFTFPYLKSTDIKVSVDEVVKTLTTHYTLHNATTIRFGTAPATGAKVKIYRDTASASLAATFYPGSAIRSSDLNDNYTQNLYVTQEAENDASTALDNSRVLESGAYVSAITKAAAAVTTANTASTNASAAVSTANTASTNASNAVSTANTASSNASSAVSTANSASTAATNATNTANTASSTATTANNTANTANTTANTASTNATTALNNSRESDGAGGYNSAISIANAAKTASDTATASVAAAQIYTVVANYAALPAISSGNHQDFYQIKDSSAVSRSSGTFTPNTVADPGSNAPTDFQGDDELVIKFRANNTSGKWDWQEYYSDDPESRYRKKLIVENKTTISENYTISANNNAFSVGPVAISSGYTVTIPANLLYFVN